MCIRRYAVEFIGTVLSRIDNRLHRDCSGSERDCSAGHRPRKLHLSRLGQTFLGALDGAT